MLFNADIRQNFTLEEVNLEKQKLAKKTFIPRALSQEHMNPTN